MAGIRDGAGDGCGRDQGEDVSTGAISVASGGSRGREEPEGEDEGKIKDINVAVGFDTFQNEATYAFVLKHPSGETVPAPPSSRQRSGNGSGGCGSVATFDR